MKEQNKNTLKIPQFPQKLPGSFWGITTFFNPQNYANKIENYQIFRNSSKKQGLKLLTVELAFGSKPCELKKKDAEILVQVRSDSVLWQKERLFNIGIKNLPEDCDKVALLDADIIFKNDNWIRETSELLERYKTVQPFKSVMKMGKNGIKEENKSFVYNISYNDVSNDKLGEFGYAWAFRREVLKKGGVYDKMILGTGDRVLGLSFYGGEKDFKWFFQKIPVKKYLEEDILKWIKEMQEETKGSLYYLDETIVHLYHGEMHNRLREARYDKQCVFDFNPNKDIELNNYGCWEWATQKPELHNYVRNYFKLRNEEGKILKNFLIYKEFPKKIFYDIDRQIGKIGILLKKKMPKLYYFLKK